MSLSEWDHGIVLQAQWSYFESGKAPHYPAVQSRCLTWCRSGFGTIVANGERYELKAGDWLLLPWNHDIAYHPYQEMPFLLGSIHVIPFLSEETGESVYWRAFHWRRVDLQKYLQRSDRPLKGFEKVFFAHADLHSPLIQLAEYIVTRYQANCSEEVLRLFPRLLRYELECVRTRTPGEEKGETLPRKLTVALNFIDRYLEVPFHLGDITSDLGCSIPTLTRLFRHYFGLPPMEFVRRKRVRHAAMLLASTRLSVADIRARILLPDPKQFNRLFREIYGVKPREYRQHPIDPGDETFLLRRPETPDAFQHFHARREVQSRTGRLE